MSFLSLIVFSSVLVMALILENQFLIESAHMPIFYTKYKNKYNLILFVMLFLIAALRNPHTGMDTYTYYFRFNMMLEDTDTLQYYWNQLIQALMSGTYKDSLNWDLFSKLFSYVFDSGQVWLAFVSGLFLFSVYITIKRYSADPVMSWVYIVYIYIFTFSLQGLRQSVAMAWILLSLKYIYERKLPAFLLMIGLATIFHQSAIVFVIAYPLYKLELSKLYFWIIGIGFAAAKLVPSVVVAVLGRFASEDRFSIYFGKNVSVYTDSAFLVLLAIFIFCYIFRDNALKRDPKTGFIYTLSMLALVFQASASVIAEMFRISYYFNMFNMLLLANVCSSMPSGKNNRILRYMIMTVFAVYFFIGGGFTYRFFWQ